MKKFDEQKLADALEEEAARLLQDKLKNAPKTGTGIYLSPSELEAMYKLSDQHGMNTGKLKKDIEKKDVRRTQALTLFCKLYRNEKIKNADTGKIDEALAEGTTIIKAVLNNTASTADEYSPEQIDKLAVKAKELDLDAGAFRRSAAHYKNNIAEVDNAFCRQYLATRMQQNVKAFLTDPAKYTAGEIDAIIAELTKKNSSARAEQFRRCAEDCDNDAEQLNEWLFDNWTGGLIPARLQKKYEPAGSAEEEPAEDPADAPATYTAAEASERLKIMQSEGFSTAVFDTCKQADGTYLKDPIDRSYLEQSEAKANRQVRSALDEEKRAAKRDQADAVNTAEPAEAIPAFINELEAEQEAPATLDQFMDDPKGKGKKGKKGKHQDAAEELQVTGIDRPFTAGTSAPWTRAPIAPVRNLKQYNAEGTYKQTLSDLGNQHRCADEFRGWIMHDRQTPRISDGDNLIGRYRTWAGTAWTVDNGNVQQSAKFISESIEAEVKPYREKLAELQKDLSALMLLKKDAKAQDKSDLDYQIYEVERDIKKYSSIVKDYENHIKVSQTAPRLKAMTDLLKSEPGFYLNFEEQATHELLAFRNGILDDRFGEKHLVLDDTAEGRELLQKLKFNYPIHYIDRTYIRNAKTPEFDKFLQPIFTDNTTEGLSAEEIIRRRDETIDFFLRVAGYTEIAGNPEQIFVMLMGLGNNGKSYLMNLIREVVGRDEFGDADGQELLENIIGKIIRNTIADSAGKRWVYFSETNGNNQKTDVDEIKRLADEGVNTDARKHENQRPKTQNFTPWASMNDMLNFNKPLTYSILRRLLPIWFTHKFNNNPDAAEKDGKTKIWKTVADKEGDAIFSRLIDEAIAYLTEKEKGKEGLLPLPEYLNNRRAELLTDASALDFIETYFLPAPKKSRDENAVLISQRDIEQMYVHYMKKTGRIHEIDVSLKDATLDAYGHFEKITKGSKARNDLRSAFNVLGFGDYEIGRARANYIWVCIKQMDAPHDYHLMDLPLREISKATGKTVAEMV